MIVALYGAFNYALGRGQSITKQEKVIPT